MTDSDFVQIFEMAPRDGLQNESAMIATSDKIRLVDLLSECGFRKIETASFVSPKWVPQMADGAQVMAGIKRRNGVCYTALTPNLKGYLNALAANVDEAAIFASASETFSQKNINCSVDESIERFAPIMEKAKHDGVPVRGYVSCVTDCPFEGRIDPDAVAKVAEKLLRLGCYEISLGDTIGHGTPDTVAGMLNKVLTSVPAEKLAGHYHDTMSRAIANISVSLEMGLRTFDSSAGGLGGCPYAPGAKGNVDTMAVSQLLESEGYTTDINSECLQRAAEYALSLCKGK